MRTGLERKGEGGATAMRQVLGADEAWDDIVARAACADFYHDRGYHLLEQQGGGGNPVMFNFNDGDISISLPLLLRPLAEVPGLEDTPWIDATSVRGYVGPLSSVEEPPPGTIAKFQATLGEFLRQLGVIAVFSRLHPLVTQHALLQELGTVRYVGETVSIDLSRDPSDRSEYRENVIRSLSRAQALGLQCREEGNWDRLDDFIRLYIDTMRRVDADRNFYFDPSYFVGLRRVFRERARLLLCFAGDEAAAAGIFIVTRGIVQYHLGGTATRFLKLSPMSMLFDGARHVFAGRHKCLHLGGGVGGRADALFHFKCGFSRRRHRFFVWEWVVQPEAYVEACSRTNRASPAGGRSFFPLYRA